VTESTVSGWGFTKNTGTYSKPSTGIPKTDLASAVQTSLGKADTALQSYTEQYKGTVTGVKINGTTKNPSSGVVDLGTVITEHQTLKTINGQSIVGSGDISISGGGSEKEIIELNSPRINISEMLPNVIYVGRFAAQSVSITSFAASDSIIDEYTLVCTTELTLEPTPISLPDDIVWANGVTPQVLNGQPFELSIRRKSYVYLAVLTPFKPAE
jgi:hypothetical protein